MINNRWVRVGLVALTIFLVNAVARFISYLSTDDATATTATTAPSTGADPISLIGAGTLVVLMIAAGAYWAVRYPFQRIFFDLGAAAVVGALLSILVGPFIGGGSPFDEELATSVAEFLQFLGLVAIGVFLGFVTMIVLGKDWKSRGLRRYEEIYRRRRPHRSVRG